MLGQKGLAWIAWSKPHTWECYHFRKLLCEVFFHLLDLMSLGEWGGEECVRERGLYLTLQPYRFLTSLFHSSHYGQLNF
jgi:hypothetical protein